MQLLLDILQCARLLFHGVLLLGPYGSYLQQAARCCHGAMELALVTTTQIWRPLLFGLGFIYCSFKMCLLINLNLEFIFLNQSSHVD